MQASEALPEQAQERLLAFHAEVDDSAAALAAVHRERLVCRRGCSACCLDDLTVFEVEAERIRRNAAAILDQAPHAAGACAFLDEDGACRVYAERPYVCRTQGLPLQVFTEDADGELQENRDICELNVEGPALATLPDVELWTLGPHELRLVKIQEQHSGGPLQRVRLRDLFRSHDSSDH